MRRVAVRITVSAPGFSFEMASTAANQDDIEHLAEALREATQAAIRPDEQVEPAPAVRS